MVVFKVPLLSAVLPVNSSGQMRGGLRENKRNTMWERPASSNKCLFGYLFVCMSVCSGSVYNILSTDKWQSSRCLEALTTMHYRLVSIQTGTMQARLRN